MTSGGARCGPSNGISVLLDDNPKADARAAVPPVIHDAALRLRSHATAAEVPNAVNAHQPLIGGWPEARPHIGNPWVALEPASQLAMPTGLTHPQTYLPALPPDLRALGYDTASLWLPPYLQPFQWLPQ